MESVAIKVAVLEPQKLDREEAFELVQGELGVVGAICGGKGDAIGAPPLEYEVRMAGSLLCGDVKAVIAALRDHPGATRFEIRHDDSCSTAVEAAEQRAWLALGEMVAGARCPSAQLEDRSRALAPIVEYLRHSGGCVG